LKKEGTEIKTGRKRNGNKKGKDMHKYSQTRRKTSMGKTMKERISMTLTSTLGLVRERAVYVRKQQVKHKKESKRKKNRQRFKELHLEKERRQTTKTRRFLLELKCGKEGGCTRSGGDGSNFTQKNKTGRGRKGWHW